MTNILSHFCKETFYPNQRDALLQLESALLSPKRFIIFESGTGSGKTVCAKTSSGFMKTAHIAVMQKILQQQYVREKIPYVNGRENFTCLNNNERCDIGACITESKFFCRYRPIVPKEITEDMELACTSASRGDLYWQSMTHCHYWTQKVNAIKSPIVVHNYPYLLTESTSVADFGTRGLLVCDEAHNLDSVISDHLSLELSDYDLQVINEHIQNVGESIHQWSPYIKIISGKFTEKAHLIQELLESGTTVKSEYYKLILKKLTDLIDKMTWFLGEYNDSPNNWIINITKKAEYVDSIQIKPIYVNKYANDVLFRLGEKVICMSATILDPVKFCKRLGIPLDQTSYINVPTPFDANRAPIYPMNLGKLNAGTFETLLPKIISTTEQIMDIHKNQKGIIHCNSKRARDMILNAINPEYKKRLLVPLSGKKSIALEKHFKSTEPTVLISISDKEALDLPDDTSRFQVVTALPFAGLDDNRMKSIMQNDGEEYELQMMISLIQSLGRSIRNVDDYAFSYVYPSQLGYYVNKFHQKFEQMGIYPSSFAHFRSRIVWNREGFGRCVI